MVACAALLLVAPAFKIRKSSKAPAVTDFRAFSSCSVLVKVSGDVVHPGVYEIGANKMAECAIKMAEPLRPLGLPLIEPLENRLLNGSTVNLSSMVDGSYALKVDRMTVAERLILNIPLDIASMSEDDFSSVPGIGPALARRICVYRQKNGGLMRIEDLVGIEGIGEKKYNLLLTYFQHPDNTR